MRATSIECKEALARALEYPGGDFGDCVRSCRSSLDVVGASIRKDFDGFAARMESMSPAEREELYIATFDFSPKSTLDLGWQLFAEDYNRGLFLAKLRAESRRLGVPEKGELPDHFPHVLRLLGRMEPAAAADLTGSCVLPALRKTIDSVDETNPYRGLLESAFGLLLAEVGTEEEAADA